MPSKATIRREKLKQLILKGYHSQEGLAKQLGVRRSTIVRDLKAIKKGVEKELQKNTETMVMDFIMRSRQEYNEALKTMLQASRTDKLSTATTAIRLMNDIRMNIIKVMQSTGFIRELAPEERGPIRIIYEDQWEEDGTKNKNERDADREDKIS